MKLVRIALLSLSLFLIPTTFLFAGKMELTTYYPSPYGEYKNLTSTEDASFATTSGKVGVGTTTPRGVLQVTLPAWSASHVNDDAYHVIFGSGGDYTYAGSTYTPGMKFGYRETGGSFPIGIINVLEPGRSWGALVLQSGGGAVGIGTEVPAGSLDVNGSVRAVTGAPTGNSSNVGYSFGPDGDTGMFRVGGTDASSAGDMAFFIDAAEKMRIVHVTGCVGIGTTTPGEKLDIYNGYGRVSSGYNWLTNSDARLKKNITTLVGSLGKVTAVRGVRFDLISDDKIEAGKGKHIGFIAQELEKEFPELVVTDEKGVKAVAYDKMTAVLVEAVKDQQAQIDSLTQKIDALESKLSTKK